MYLLSIRRGSLDLNHGNLVGNDGVEVFVGFVGASLPLLLIATV